MIRTMSQQEIFTKVKEHLLTQNAQALSAQGVCRYRGENGLKCAVGCLIDEEYKFSMESNTFRYIFKSGNWTAEEQMSFGALILPLLAGLQNIHDNDEPNNWEQKLRELAGKFGLKYD